MDPVQQPVKIDPVQHSVQVDLVQQRVDIDRADDQTDHAFALLWASASIGGASRPPTERSGASGSTILSLGTQPRP